MVVPALHSPAHRLALHLEVKTWISEELWRNANVKRYQELLPSAEGVEVGDIVVGTDEPVGISKLPCLLLSTIKSVSSGTRRVCFIWKAFLHQTINVKWNKVAVSGRLPAQTVAAIADNFTPLQRCWFLSQRSVERHRFDAQSIHVLVMLRGQKRRRDARLISVSTAQRLRISPGFRSFQRNWELWIRKEILAYLQYSCVEEL